MSNQAFGSLLDGVGSGGVVGTRMCLLIDRQAAKQAPTKSVPRDHAPPRTVSVSGIAHRCAGYRYLFADAKSQLESSTVALSYSSRKQVRSESE